MVRYEIELIDVDSTLHSTEDFKNALHTLDGAPVVEQYDTLYEDEGNAIGEVTDSWIDDYVMCEAVVEDDNVNERIEEGAVSLAPAYIVDQGLDSPIVRFSWLFVTEQPTEEVGEITKVE